MRVEFHFGESRKRPSHHVASASVVFDHEEGDLAGLVISNFDIWGRRDGLPGISVTVPSRRLRNDADGRPRWFPIVHGPRGSGLGEIRRRILAELCGRHPEVVARFGGFVVDADDVTPVDPRPADQPAHAVAS